MNEIEKIIQNEDKKNPLTDESIASMLNISRELVTEYRLLNGIPDSRERRRPYLYEDAKRIITLNRDISDRKLTKELNDLGYDVSRFVVSQIKKEILNVAGNVDAKSNAESVKKVDLVENVEKIQNTKKVLNLEIVKNLESNMESSTDNDGQLSDDQLLSFKEIVGFNGSLRMQISQAMAAVLYPPHGLHTLILGPSGVGKSQLAEAMYKFALESGRLTKDNPFIVFNCADYADNPQLLLAQLFGYNKGSFTGADTPKAGLVEKANGGILFLDEVHRLPSEGQEILFYLLDKGKYRRLGETENTRESKIMLIAATSENPESSLLLTFRRRIPMVIELPSINDRPFSERYSIINYFFAEESFRINRPIKIKVDVIRSLMLYDCPGNIGQLRSDIQVSCARGFLNTLGSKDEIIKIDLSCLPNHVRTGILKLSERNHEIDKYVYKDILVYPDKKSRLLSGGDRYVLPNEIYQFIEDRFKELKSQGISMDDINKIVGSQVETELKRFAENTKKNSAVSKQEVKEIVGEKIVSAVEDAIKIANSYYKDISSNFFYSLAIHLSAAYERLKCGKSIINPRLESIKKEYADEYKVAREMVDKINEKLEIKLTDDEVGFVAMYLKTFLTNEDKNKKRVAVIVLTHGHVAKGMAEVANKLLGVNIAHGIEMELDEKPEDALQRTIEVVKKVDEGRGCLILIDMGSLITFGEIITKSTGIPTRTIGRVDTVMVLEAVRAAIIPDVSLDDIANALDVSKSYIGHVEGVKDSYNLPKAIVAICITGEGTAIKIQKYINDKIRGINDTIKIIPIGMAQEYEIDEQIAEIRSKNNIVAFVGTIDPEVEGVPFISTEEIMSGGGLERLKKIIGMEKRTKNSLEEVISEDLILYNLEADNKNDAIDKIIELLELKGCVNKDFMLSVYKRESIGPTWIKGGIAIPHGSTKHVIKPAIAIAKLKKPIQWEEELQTDLIFLIALKEDSKNYIHNLYKIFKNENSINALRTAESTEEIKKILLSNTIPTI
ncbi:sigma 54-interacting transcriptional regulator [Fonticella tunisiensis]|uniref:Sigma 54 modulation protein n=1 Tax=Fonticella tunisiensis TaxID=1096341 RepID=A0A4R7KV23_9CLOT|nr:sigma 54-interacting transcriptional regulator [Fonticella tunisiensis]TDT63604.1 sigma 54 modulation protein [Fonticella tunisiensis]